MYENACIKVMITHDATHCSKSSSKWAHAMSKSGIEIESRIGKHGCIIAMPLE